VVKIEKVFFNGKELTQYITIASDFHLWQGADFSPQFSDGDILSGSEFYYTKFGKKVISVPFFNCTGSFDDYNQLLRILNVKEPKELRFSSRPNIVFYAIPNVERQRIICIRFDEIANQTLIFNDRPA
jgi:phage-related protein